LHVILKEKLAEAKRKFENLKSELIEHTSLDRTGRFSSVHRKTTMADIEEDEEDEEEAAKNKSEVADLLNEVSASSGLLRKRANKQRASVISNVLSNANSGAQTITQRLLEKNRERQAKKKQFRKVYDLKLAFSEFYLSLILLQNYQNLNFTGFKKILKKHDKVRVHERMNGGGFKESLIFNSFGVCRKGKVLLIF
jgi:hypothetical protein